MVLLSLQAVAQYSITGKVINAETQEPVAQAEVFNKTTDMILTTDKDGKFQFKNLKKGQYKLLVFSYQYDFTEQIIDLNQNTTVVFSLEAFSDELDEVVINQKREEVFGISRLNAVEGTSIFAGKKTEVILIDQAIGNLASNNARQIYGQVVGLNIYDSNDAGLQLSIGGRGLEPNRTANFNTRQNDYDISADVLGYPESYYTPPAEALKEIQIIRGAASLQFGSQFGGLINFKFKDPEATKPLALLSRQSIGSFGLFTSFNSLSGTIGKFSYYTYFNHKSGDGFRPNASFDSQNFFAGLRYQFSQNTKISVETTYLNYLAKQPGGLTDDMFLENSQFSNRTRNWFEVDWRLFSARLDHKFSARTNLSINFFGLDASRKAVGFRGNPLKINESPIEAPDETDEQGNFVNPRDLLIGDFSNWGIETRLLTRYNIKGKDAVFLIGVKTYKSNNTSRQGPGSNRSDADFRFATDQYPDYANQSSFVFPNANLAIFGENIFMLSEKLSITPGFRFEHIKTESQGQYTDVIPNLAGKIDTTFLEADNRSLRRSFMLFGLGASYQATKSAELYVNVSQNYRSVTFDDIRVVNPSFSIDPDIADEQGYTADFGLRGKWNENLSYDLGGFGLIYDDRIGVVLDDRAKRIRKNIGKAFIYGFEGFVSWNAASLLFPAKESIKLNWFTNMSLTSSQYVNIEENNVTGNKVEFIPGVNLKTGLKFGYKNLMSNIQFTYLSKQYTDVENSERAEAGDIKNGIIGIIPAYHILDISASYKFSKNWRLEAGINNALDTSYFTQRATGYPGPGIIPSQPKAFYTSLQFKL